MAIITRLSRLFRADVHAVLDRLEEPDVLLRQAIREMEEQVAQNTRALKATELEQQQARHRCGEVGKSLQGIAGEIDLCFGAGNEALVRQLLRRRLEGEKLIGRLAQRGAALEAALGEQRTRLDQQRQQLESMRQKAALFDAEPARGDGSEPAPWGTPDVVVTDADVELALLREQQQRRTP